MRTRRKPSLSHTSSPWLFGLVVLGVCVVCLSFAEHMEGKTVARWELANDTSVLMSCTEEPSSTNEPLWCANPDSPHCTRGTPAPGSSEPWLGPVFASLDGAPKVPQLLSGGTTSAPSAGALLGHAQTEGDRLERPPRRA
jgi:hypothetical protein